MRFSKSVGRLRPQAFHPLANALFFPNTSIKQPETSNQ